MRDRIAAIIIDKDCKERDYSEIAYYDGNYNSERGFDLEILETADGIFGKIHDFNSVDSIITVGDRSCWGDLYGAPYSIRRKWTHIDNYNPEYVKNCILATFLENLKYDGPLLFSFFTCTHNTSKEVFARLYNSMCNQTYKEWDWFIVDDSDDDSTCEMIESFKDPRIFVVKTHTLKGNIGFNKHLAAMMCDGDILCEVDHDDELTTDCLETIKGAYEDFPDSDFFYSLCLELKGKDLVPIVYGKGWGWGEGLTKTEVVNGVEYTFSATPGVNPFSIRTIYSQPNHIRCWRRDFYHKIGGHNTTMSVLDDQEILIRTFLQGNMTKIDKVLYIQYEGDGERGISKDNTQSLRFGEIQRTTMLLKSTYDEEIHKRILSKGFEDTAWDDGLGYSILWKEHTPGENVMSNLYIPIK